MKKEEKFTPSCYYSHPALELGGSVVYGGNASTPKVKTADIYLSLQDYSSCGLASMPWELGGVKEVFYPMVDMNAPKDSKSFMKMIDWLCTQLQEGKKLHVGCVGGHGRTGVVLSALVATLLDEKKAIEYVRKNYCNRAVESDSQIAFLAKYFGVEKVSGSKSTSLVMFEPKDDDYKYYSSSKEYKKYTPASNLITSSGKFNGVTIPTFGARPEVRVVKESRVLSPVQSVRNLWANPLDKSQKLRHN